MQKIYENIKKLRLSHNMSQQELAELVGYKGKSMIAKIEKGEVDLPTTMVSKFAEVFNCSESFLMGWEEQSKEELLNTRMAQLLAMATKNDKAKQVIEKFNRLSTSNQDLVLTLMDSLITDSIPTLEPPQNQE